ncbi:uncharacterized protein MONOS_12669 [Monocercomonoides exilis]|uniref:uncharacterized protein n=1 Tax=Monocercomonoides exilis TaxID=2049356 RepID=UPI00355A000A|nr:hypothetical protein MONOS_12669 [Monocercomonoides exilis]|eukprot:MONOS_12669.1-p1 / transcript=MONOS_12669.1 / gene=MONOS_12669 / organism=Monocercomonoides_exilis_PA203 / gene_product=hypothetical protein / transcript_product=hypothetical protein / location=Mono_scaffold00717:9888-12968(+) / protein_length=987 / sequence_SO=supercontig / SO=protein_coding / is_pseudo=false
MLANAFCRNLSKKVVPTKKAKSESLNQQNSYYSFLNCTFYNFKKDKVQDPFDWSNPISMNRASKLNNKKEDFSFCGIEESKTKDSFYNSKCTDERPFLLSLEKSCEFSKPVNHTDEIQSLSDKTGIASSKRLCSRNIITQEPVSSKIEALKSASNFAPQISLNSSTSKKMIFSQETSSTPSKTSSDILYSHLIKPHHSSSTIRDKCIQPQSNLFSLDPILRSTVARVNSNFPFVSSSHTAKAMNSFLHKFNAPKAGSIESSAAVSHSSLGAHSENEELQAEETAQSKCVPNFQTNEDESKKQEMLLAMITELRVSSQRRFFSDDVDVAVDGEARSAIVESRRNAMQREWRKEDIQNIYCGKNATPLIQRMSIEQNVLGKNKIAHDDVIDNGRDASQAEESEDSTNQREVEKDEGQESICNEGYLYDGSDEKIGYQDILIEGKRPMKKRRELIKKQIRDAKQHFRAFGEWVRKDWMEDSEEIDMWNKAEQKLNIGSHSKPPKEQIGDYAADFTIEELREIFKEAQEENSGSAECEKLEKTIQKMEMQMKKDEEWQKMTDVDRFELFFTKKEENTTKSHKKEAREKKEDDELSRSLCKQSVISSSPATLEGKNDQRENLRGDDLIDKSPCTSTSQSDKEEEEEELLQQKICSPSFFKETLSASALNGFSSSDDSYGKATDPQLHSLNSPSSDIPQNSLSVSDLQTFSPHTTESKCSTNNIRKAFLIPSQQSDAYPSRLNGSIDLKKHLLACPFQSTFIQNTSSWNRPACNSLSDKPLFFNQADERLHPQIFHHDERFSTPKAQNPHSNKKSDKLSAFLSELINPSHQNEEHPFATSFADTKKHSTSFISFASENETAQISGNLEVEISMPKPIQVPLSSCIGSQNVHHMENVVTDQAEYLTRFIDPFVNRRHLRKMQRLGRLLKKRLADLQELLEEMKVVPVCVVPFSFNSLMKFEKDDSKDAKSKKYHMEEIKREIFSLTSEENGKS